MVTSAPRPAIPGDVFILLLPAPALPPAASMWQSALQAQYGGLCTEPLHVSLQRFTCIETGKLAPFFDELQKTTAILPPIPIVGNELQSLYSTFRQTMILKCRILVNEPLQALTRIVLHQMQAHQLAPHFPWNSELITVLEDIERLPTESTVTLPTLLHLFTGRQILISRIVAPGRYQTLRQWQWHSTA